MLAVGDSTTLEIIFSTKTYRNRVTKRPKVVTNEGPPDKNVQIIAHIVQRPDSTYPVVMNPYKLDLSQFTTKVRDKISFKISNVSDIELHPTLVALSEDIFELELPDKIPAGGEAEAVLKLKKDALELSFEKSFTLQFDDEKTSRFTIPVKRTVRVAGNPPGTTAGKGTRGGK
ncbi:MAG: hypothetical protein P1R58_06250 [bacterium]|nr:hypothetical protein [bacterium]